MKPTIMLRIAKAFLYLQVVGLAVFGLFFLFSPAAAGAKVSIAPLDFNGASELRAFYGGSFIAMSLLILVGLRSSSEQARGFLNAMALVMALIAMGRMISFFADGISQTTIGAAVMESLIGFCCWSVARQGKRDDGLL